MNALTPSATAQNALFSSGQAIEVLCWLQALFAAIEQMAQSQPTRRDHIENLAALGHYIAYDRCESIGHQHEKMQSNLETSQEVSHV